jgi:tRNA pseudouridine55 synthase
MTSHDVVDAVRRMSGQRKVGHAGTLDPLATGVLLLCLGWATRLSEYLMPGLKRYRATCVLGATTDTYDADGRLLTSGGRTDFSRPAIEDALASFVGPGEQVPPMYSAIKHKGQPLYKLARRGETIARKTRPVEILEMLLVHWSPPSLTFEVGCSPGTYVRSLVHDLGHRLGSGAYLSSLIRLSSGAFSLENSVSLSRLEEAFRTGGEAQYLIPGDEALIGWPAMIVSGEDERRIIHGMQVAGALDSQTDRLPTWCRAYGLGGEFLAIMRFDADNVAWQPSKVFVSPPTA